MSNRPWMPLYVSDYLTDTIHLRTVDHGAYLLLIMHYWCHGGLPQDDRQLARIVRLPLRTWVQSVRPVIETLFRPGWKHKRIDQELHRQDVIRTKRAIAGHKGGIAYHRPTLPKPVSRPKADNTLTTKSPRYLNTFDNDFNGGLEANAEQMESSHSHIRKKEGSAEKQDPVDNSEPLSELQAIVYRKGWA